LPKKQLLIWDADGEPPAGEWLTVLWRSYETGSRNNVISLPRLVEDNAESLRAQYLEWIYKLGETKIKGKRIVDHLEIRPGFSFWWMTILAQKCTYALSPQIYQAIRLLALEKALCLKDVQKIKIVTADRLLTRELKEWCSFKGIKIKVEIKKSFQWAPLHYFSFFLVLKKILFGLLTIALFYIRRFPAQNEFKSRKGGQINGVMFFDILAHFNKILADKGKFESGYWTKLPALMKELDLRANWAHLFYKHHQTPNMQEAINSVKGLNQDSIGPHLLIDQYLSIRCLRQTIYDYIILILRWFTLQLPICNPAGSNFSFRNIMGNDWDNSFLGQFPAGTLCHLNMFESFVKAMPHQRMGVYIQENQPWEFALIHAWRTAGHVSIIGTPHTTIPFWDLRYFSDKRISANYKKNKLPAPDFCALNAPSAFSVFNKMLNSDSRLKKVEALRYINANASCSHDKRLIQKNAKQKKNVVLVGTDLFDSNTLIQLNWLSEAMLELPISLKIIIRPHPASEFSAKKFPLWQSRVDRSCLECLLKRVDVIFSSNSSSIAVDGIIAGKRIITMLNPNTLNFSPLRGVLGNVFVCSPAELRKRLLLISRKKSFQKNNYFYRDGSLKKWKFLLMKDQFVAQRRIVE
jgi:surface carbohydrate biosynthesis protein (TIGR04326 family)